MSEPEQEFEDAWTRFINDGPQQPGPATEETPTTVAENLASVIEDIEDLVTERVTHAVTQAVTASVVKALRAGALDPNVPLGPLLAKATQQAPDPDDPWAE